MRPALGNEGAVLGIARDAQMAHDGASPLGGAVGFPNGDVVACRHQGPTDELGNEHVALAADPSDDDVQRVFRVHLRLPPG